VGCGKVGDGEREVVALVVEVGGRVGPHLGLKEYLHTYMTGA
jgi:hypothetical protein